MLRKYNFFVLARFSNFNSEVSPSVAMKCLNGYTFSLGGSPGIVYKFSLFNSFGSSSFILTLPK